MRKSAIKDLRILAVASLKGGVGKTTLTAHLAVQAERSSQGPVALIDTDPQGSLSAWWNSRESPTPSFASVDVSELPSHVSALRAHARLILIDTPPAFLPTVQAAVAVADLVLIPARPSPHDLRAVSAVVDIVEEAEKPFVFVLNAATPRSIIALEAVRALAQHGKVAPVTIHHRIDFAASMVDGRTVGELDPNSRSAEEVSSLWLYVNSQLRKYKAGGMTDLRKRGRTHG
jgi:chromosome partitioning protein